MSLLRWVVIWSLTAMLVACLVAMAVLYVTRDTGQRASGARSGACDGRRVTLPYLFRPRPPFERVALPYSPPAMAPVRPWNDDGTWAHATCPECGISWNLPSPGCPHLIWNAHPRQPRAQAPPPVSEDATARLTRALIEASIRRVYADSERRQALKLAQTAWSTWQA